MPAKTTSPASPTAATRHWLLRTVIGENFCPFAKREFERNSIHYQVCTESGFEQQALCVMQECERLMAHDEIETTLVIFSPSEPSPGRDHNIEAFDDFLALADQVNWLMQRAQLDGTLQLATFHPRYVFAGEDESSPSHYTNRAPFPTLHLIRERSIDRALKTFKDPDSIPQTNIQRTLEQGAEFYQTILTESLLQQ